MICRKCKQQTLERGISLVDDAALAPWIAACRLRQMLSQECACYLVVKYTHIQIHNLDFFKDAFIMIH